MDNPALSHSIFIDTVSLPSSCLGADDGYQWMKLLDGDQYPAVHQLCDDEYMVIDINEDPNIVDYSSSYDVASLSLSVVLHLHGDNTSGRVVDGVLYKVTVCCVCVIQ